MIRGERCEEKDCGDNAVVPVLDKNIERSPRPGNKFRQCCMACGSWQKMTSREHFKNHNHPHVLPLGESEKDGLVRLSDYDYGPEWDELVEQVTDDEPEPEPEPDQQVALTDGGVDEPADLDEHDTAESDERDDNSFVCPSDGCDTEHTGFPEKCHNCGAVYQWKTNT